MNGSDIVSTTDFMDYTDHRLLYPNFWDRVRLPNNVCMLISVRTDISDALDMEIQVYEQHSPFRSTTLGYVSLSSPAPERDGSEAQQRFGRPQQRQ